MDWLDFGAVNWLAVAIAFVASFVLGWFWYSQFGLFPLWARLGKLDLEELGRTPMVPIFVPMVAANVAGIILLALLVEALEVGSWATGAATGAIIGLVFRGGAHAIHNGFAMRHPGITVIDAAHDTLALAVAGAILSAM